MAFVAWEQRFSVGNTQIDSQHRQLFDLVNELHNSLLRGAGPGILHSILEKLLAYTHLHFNTEERIMLSTGYPDFAEHKAEHDRLAAQVLEYVEGLKSGRLTLTTRVSYFLRDWLLHHILESDRDIGASCTEITCRPTTCGPQRGS
jgi:hemerythrin-like metal-binding protein